MTILECARVATLNLHRTLEDLRAEIVARRSMTVHLELEDLLHKQRELGSHYIGKPFDDEGCEEHARLGKLRRELMGDELPLHLALCELASVLDHLRDSTQPRKEDLMRAHPDAAGCEC